MDLDDKVKLAEVHTNVKSLMDVIPVVRRHDNELFALKLFLFVATPIFTFWVANKLGIQIF